MVPPVGETHFGRGDMRVTSIHHLQSAVSGFLFTVLLVVWKKIVSFQTMMG